MLYQLINGTIRVGGEVILDRVNFEIHGNEKIAIVGKNGAGKTTLLRTLAGELKMEMDDKTGGGIIKTSRKLTIDWLRQKPIANQEQTVEQVILAQCPMLDYFDRERYFYEKEYDKLFTGFGFQKDEKTKKISEFSGGEQTKIALIRLLLKKPDILLLDEPTNHLDSETVEWLETYLQSYPNAVVMVSHDRFFLDRVAQVVYETEGKKLQRYPGNYSYYKRQKQKKLQEQWKHYEQQQEERKRLTDLVEKFKNKPKKAAFARTRKKMLEKMELVEKPDEIPGWKKPEINPLTPGRKWVYEAEALKIGYTKALLEITLRIRRGQKIAVLGANGSGKSTFLKTMVGKLPKLGGKQVLDDKIQTGYFEQLHEKSSETLSVREHFGQCFPELSEKEVRTILAAYLFEGKKAGICVNALSGGEIARLLLAEMLQQHCHFLVLDEPTNHMDIPAREMLECTFREYEGTMLFVSHDRYFISQVADALLLFEDGQVLYYPFGYEHYLEKCRNNPYGEELSARIKAEEQALIAGLKDVPKAERHRLREMPTQEAYIDWKLRLAKERITEWETKMECFEAQQLAAKLTEENWNADSKDVQKEIEAGWTQACLDWYDVILETEFSD